MIRIIGALAVGLLFGAGVSVSGMINPAKVLGFLDFAGNWDPTLGLVMLGALIAAVPGYALLRRAMRSRLGSATGCGAGRSK